MHDIDESEKTVVALLQFRKNRYNLTDVRNPRGRLNRCKSLLEDVDVLLIHVDLTTLDGVQKTISQNFVRHCCFIERALLVGYHIR